MNSKNKKLLKLVFEDPVRADLEWREIERLYKALGGDVSEGSGFRVRVLLNGRVAIFHRPHPEKTTSKAALKSVRLFLSNAGIKQEVE